MSKSRPNVCNLYFKGENLAPQFHSTRYKDYELQTSREFSAKCTNSSKANMKPANYSTRPKTTNNVTSLKSSTHKKSIQITLSFPSPISLNTETKPENSARKAVSVKIEKPSPKPSYKGFPKKVCFIEQKPKAPSFLSTQNYTVPKISRMPEKNLVTRSLSILNLGFHNTIAETESNTKDFPARPQTKLQVMYKRRKEALRKKFKASFVEEFPQMAGVKGIQVRPLTTAGVPREFYRSCAALVTSKIPSKEIEIQTGVIPRERPTQKVVVDLYNFKKGVVTQERPKTVKVAINEESLPEQMRPLIQNKKVILLQRIPHGAKRLVTPSEIQELSNDLSYM